VNIGYYAEEQLQTLGRDISVIELLEEEAPTELVPKLRGYLGAFLFRGDDIYKSVRVLSGGEKSRLAILRIILHPLNLLILDEPTNHLDIHSKEILLEALQNYQGTVVFVSHDRYFLERLTTKVLEIRQGGGKLFYGDYGYYLWKTGAEAENSGGARGEPADEEPAASEGRLQYKDEKQRKQEARRRQREEERLLQELDEADRKINELQQSLNDPNVYSHPEKAKQVQLQIDETEERQHTILETLESLEAIT